MFSFIKKIFYNSHLDFLNVKDIIIAKRYESEEEKMKIQEGHRISPYIVIYKRFKKVYALECTSVKKSNALSLSKIEFKTKRGYNLSKGGYIFTGKLVLLNEERFIEKVGVLDDEDLNRIYKSIYLLNDRYYKIKDINAKNIKFYYEVGDIVLYNNYSFYIYSMDEENYYLISVYANKKGKIKINNTHYIFNFNTIISIPIDSKIKLMNITDEDMRKHIELYVFNNKNKTKKDTTNVLCRGKLIKYDNKYYYIYGEYQDKLLLYIVYSDNDFKEGMKEILIGNKIYYTYFEEFDLPSNIETKIVSKAKDEEMNNIKKIKETIKKESKEVKEETIIFKAYKPGYLMMNIDTMDRYIIIERNKNTIVYASLENISEYIEFTFSENCEFDYSVLDKMDKYKFQNILKKYNDSINEEK